MLGVSMKNPLLAVLAILGVALVAWEFIPIQVSLCDGSYNLTVRIKSSVGQPSSVSCEVFGNLDYAKEVVDNQFPPETEMWSRVVDPFDGQPITVSVPLTERLSPLGRELSRVQFRYLAVIAVLPDGKRIGKLVNIPDCRELREVSVVLP